VAKRLQDRLVGHHGLARRASGQHDRSRRVHAPGDVAGQCALADPGVAGQEHELTRASLPAGQRPQLFELGELSLAADQRALGAVAQIRGQRDRWPRPATVP
jgi:hypothetical protein